MTAGSEWWRGGVIYQIYPRSFADSNGDGIGDLAGIRESLEYVARLGVDGIWISPFFPSPMKDFGYDVADYCDVDPMFGSLSDFDNLIAEAHRLGLAVMIDQVLSHTSDAHAWFDESRQDRTNPKADWYVWANAQPDGSPPNNWQSVFGGPAWQWDTRRCQYYLHNFLPSQPDLNHHNPEVRAALRECMRFWLDRGVDGFRLDAINFAFHDRQLRDNPPMESAPYAEGEPPDNPYMFQDHVYDKSRPEMPTLLKELRSLADEYGDICLLAEIGDDSRRSRQLMAEYTGGDDKLHMGYSFDLLGEDGSPAHIRNMVEGVEKAVDDGYPCWSIGNHDVPRVVTRWGNDARPETVAPLYAALLLSLRGGLCFYQGDELALPEAELTYDQLQDPVGIAMWPRNKGRDGCRTPMPWRADDPGAGFTTGTPWLPIPDAHRERAVDRQAQRAEAPMERVRRLLHWRRHHRALIHGSLTFMEAPKEVLMLCRDHAEERVVAAFNLSAETVRIPWSSGEMPEALTGHGFSGEVDGSAIVLAPYDAFFGRM